MSTAASARREWWPWLGHNAWRLQFGVFVAWAVSLFMATSVTLLILLASLPVFVVLSVAELLHDRRLCDVCVAGWPLDPQAEVDRQRRWLHFDHRWVDAPRGRVTVLCVVLVVASLLLAAVVFFTDQRWPQQVYSLALYLFFGLAAYARHVHKRLQPWCPWCHRDDGEHFHPEPVAPPSVQADR